MAVWWFVVTVTAAIEHECHEPAADYERKDDAEDHSHVAVDAHLYINRIPGVDGQRDGYTYKREKDENNESTLHRENPVNQLRGDDRRQKSMLAAAPDPPNIPFRGTVRAMS